MMKGRRGTAAAGSIFETGAGFGAVVASEEGVLEVFLPFDCPTREAMAEQLRTCYPGLQGESPLSRRAARLLVDYFAGRAVNFDLPVDESRFTPFQREVYALVQRIPRGEILTYGQVAVALGRPGAARGIGVAMARNPVPIVIPCHRVLGAGGMMIGYSGPGGIESKRWLLALEKGATDNSPEQQ